MSLLNAIIIIENYACATSANVDTSDARNDASFANVFLFQPLTSNNLLTDFVRVSNFGDIKMVKIFAVFRTVIKNRSRREKRSGRMGRIVGSLKRLIAIRQLNSSK